MSKKIVEHKNIINSLKVVYSNFLNRVYKAVSTILDKNGNVQDLDFNEVIDSLSRNEEYVFERFLNLQEAIANGIVKQTTRGTSLRNVVQRLNASGKERLSELALSHSKSISGTLQDELKLFFKDVADRDLPLLDVKQELLDKFKEKITEGKADTIARTEYRAAYNFGQNNAVEQLQEKGVTIVRTWVTSGDNVRESHDIDGEERGPLERFSNGLLYPMEEGAPIEEVINCNCSLDINEIKN